MTDPVCPECHGRWTRRHRCLTGPMLAEMRTMAGYTQADVADAWPCTKANISLIERTPIPTSSAASAYQAALDRVRTKGDAMG
jgi:hypothetical protein